MKDEIKMGLYEDCTLCPRECHVNREAEAVGYCGQSSRVKAARAALHYWEEPCLSGEKGSGTVFFTGCSLGCIYCQNHTIASGKSGIEITAKRLCEIFLELQEKQALNINLVTPSHFMPTILNGINTAKQQGLRIPVIYNTSGYEKAETIKMLQRAVDIYLPDFKYMDTALAKKYSNAPDYFKYAQEALAEMVRQQPIPKFDENGIMTNGVIVRHLALPGQIEDSKRVIKYLYKTYKNNIYISIMNQYTPINEFSEYRELNRMLSEREYEELVDFAINLGVGNGFIQEGETAAESFIPEFNNEGIVKGVEEDGTYLI